MTGDSRNTRIPELIKRELRELESTSLSSKEWVQSHPRDTLVSFLIEQDKTRRDSLLSELEESYIFYHQHQISYAIKTDDRVEVSEFSSLITSFKNAVTATLNDIFPGNNSLPLYVDTIFQSSYGVLLSTEWDSELISTKIEGAFNTFFNVVRSLGNNPNDLESDPLVTFFNNKLLLRRYRTFYRTISSCERTVNLSWRSFNIINKREFSIDPASASNIYSKLSNWQHPEPESIQVTGSIQGVSLIDQTIQFVPFKKEGAKIKIYFDDQFKEQLRHLLGETATIIYVVTEDYHPEDDTIISRKTLSELNSGQQ